MTTLDQDSGQEIRDLLMGHRVAKVSDDTLLMDNGVTLQFEGHDGGCACSAGCYDLTELNGVDNVITNVQILNAPGGDGYESYEGHYQIFVFADNQRINLATFEGSDGNGYYGTGYAIRVRRPSSAVSS